MRSLALVCVVAGVAGQATELSLETWDKEVVQSGKSAFVKFFAPWCGHCKKIKPDWDSLGAIFKDSKTVIVADVDCTAAGKSLCDKMGVRGYPSLKFFNPPDEEGEDYKGGRDLNTMKKFVETDLGPGCSVDMKENCSAEQLAALQQYIDMDATERTAKLESMKKAMADAEETHNELLKTLQSTFKESQEGLEKIKEDSAPTIKLLKAASPSGKAAASKDEM